MEELLQTLKDVFILFYFHQVGHIHGFNLLSSNLSYLTVSVKVLVYTICLFIAKVCTESNFETIEAQFLLVGLRKQGRWKRRSNNTILEGHPVVIYRWAPWSNG